ncbi:hypothetical protein Q7C36_015347 [Tachysurus vachellii]|uniref:Uncharacterized protein n=1 Tax=Tachysurus vachellii TaxID=175792 RepID=A0AA88SK92_TACVA|nr:hypothetical protein Q7C36_015347 [Tachysurus vachellii]
MLDDVPAICDAVNVLLRRVIIIKLGLRQKLGIALYTSRGMLLRERNLCESSGECGSALLKALGQGLAFVL